MSVRRSPFARLDMTVELWASVCVRRNHSCICCQHSISFFFSFSRCPPVSCPVVCALSLVKATTKTTTGSSANYLMSTFQLINCNCSAFDSKLADEREIRCICARAHRLDAACMLDAGDCVCIWCFLLVCAHASGFVSVTDCDPLFFHSPHS